MTEEEIDLLIKDLCSRLSYGVKVQYNNEIYDIDYISALYEEVHLDIPDNYTIGISEIKPYLRPLYSMTKEERAERVAILWELEGHIDEDITYKYQDWLLSHHFDFRNLIGKGLALEAPKGMYEFL